MKSIDIKKLYLIHTWVGLVTGILLFVIAFTGALSVFGRPEIKIWANPDIRQGIDINAQQIEQVIEANAKMVPEAFHEEILVFLPGARTYPNLTVLFEDHENRKAILLTLDNTSLEVLDRREGSPQEVFAARQIDIADFIVDFHADLHLGRPVGLLITGLLGLTLMASIVTGFIIHRQKLKQLFSFRRQKSFDITLADSHKLFGVWGLLFNGIIAFTGAFLGLASVILIPAAAFVSFNGDQDKLIEAFNTTPPPVLSQEYSPTHIAPVLEHARAFDADMTIEVITIYGYQDQNALVYVSAVGSESVARQLLSYSGATGEFKEAFGQFGKVGGISAAILDLMFPLHFGNFGGAFVKLLWTVLGLSTALLPLSGLMLWIERGQRAAVPRYSKQTYERFNRLVIGSCGGVVVACASLFVTQLIMYSLSIVKNTGVVIGAVFFTLWCLSIIWAMLASTIRVASSTLFYVSGLLLIVAVPVNMLATNHNFISLLINKHWVAGLADLSLLSMGVLICWCTIKLTRNKEAENSQKEMTNSLSPQEKQ